MSWTWNKFDEDWKNQYEVIKSLPKPCQDVYACCTVVDKINNGGLNQLFFNSTGQLARMAQDGFLAIGNANLSRIMKVAIEVFNENFFDKLDDDFSFQEPKFDSLLETYIRINVSVFGD